MTDFTVEQWPERPWVGVRMTAELARWGEVNAHVPRIYAALAAADAIPAGGPIYQYHRLQRADDPMDITVSVPVLTPVELPGLDSGSVPAGRYLVARPDGGPDTLERVHEEMWRWAQMQELELAINERADGIHWDARTEQFLTDPRIEPDHSKWEVEVAYLLR